ncbi:hypothetical protein [Sporomusa sp.]|jgi:hypothetical protein|uniref:hypothetical protein n=1 Tax=Sporomusa sp. TaxID=2078658 RepID=UPI002CB46D66|nr:hypothetical protein [Sporomusa sp.]HWR05756.1 hypothetical protein [Sporomusa sp.]
MLASYDKIVKYIVEKLQMALSPLQQITQNQEIIIAQNKQMIDLLATLSNSRETGIVQKEVVSNETVSDQDTPAEA